MLMIANDRVFILIWSRQFILCGSIDPLTLFFNKPGSNRIKKKKKRSEDHIRVLSDSALNIKLITSENISENDDKE